MAYFYDLKQIKVRFKVDLDQELDYFTLIDVKKIIHDK